MGRFLLVYLISRTAKASDSLSWAARRWNYPLEGFVTLTS